MNKVILMGRLTRDPEVRYSSGDSSMAIARFSIAVDRRFRRNGDEQTTDFFNCTAFGKLGEFVEKYLRKGTKVVLDGELRNDNYTNKNGEKVYSMNIVANNIEFAESKNAAGNDGSAQGFMPNTAPMQNEAPDDGFMNMPEDMDDSLPFS
ncbi:MAG: single-stranded DNA-binding protein [Lachnospiraceae bacterium]|nr:single-stranded DNA-binding protein [Lachnospiraceae bacterium]